MTDDKLNEDVAKALYDLYKTLEKECERLNFELTPSDLWELYTMASERDTGEQ